MFDGYLFYANLRDLIAHCRSSGFGCDSGSTTEKLGK